MSYIHQRSQGCDGGSGVTGMMPTGGGDLTTDRIPRIIKCTGVYLGWYLAYLRILYQVPPRTKLNHEVGGAIHTSEVAVNGRSASPWAAAGTAAARVRSSKVYGLRSKGILLAKEGNGDLSEVSGEHHKAWRMCYMRCEHLFTPLTDPIIPVAPTPRHNPGSQTLHMPNTPHAQPLADRPLSRSSD